MIHYSPSNDIQFEFLSIWPCLTLSKTAYCYVGDNDRQTLSMTSSKVLRMTFRSSYVLVKGLEYSPNIADFARLSAKTQT